MVYEAHTKDGKRPLAVVTGASSGIGLALAKQFAEHNFDLLLVAEDSGINDVRSTFRPSGIQVQTYQIDLSTYDGVEALCQAIKATGRPVDSIAINAGVGVGGRFADQTDLQAELNLINLNVVSSVHLAKRVLHDMLDRGFGRVLITSSIAATAAGPFEAVYAASKAFLFSFSEALRHELKDTGITVTALMPGPTETNFFHRAHMDNTRLGSEAKADPADVARAGYEALMAGKDHVVAGTFGTKMQAALSDLVPEGAKAEMHGRMAKPKDVASDVS